MSVFSIPQNGTVAASLLCVVCEEPLSGGIDTFGPIGTPLCQHCHLAGAVKLLAVTGGGALPQHQGKRLYHVVKTVRVSGYVMAADENEAAEWAEDGLDAFDGDSDDIDATEVKSSHFVSKRDRNGIPDSVGYEESRTVADILAGDCSTVSVPVRLTGDLAVIAEDVRDRQMRRMLAAPGRGGRR